MDEPKPGKCLTHTVVSVTYLGTVKMADPIGELNAIFAMCGIADKAMRANIIAQEVFTQLEDLGVLESDTNVMEMAKRMASDSGQR
jgi:hypothetical protein